MEKEKIYAAIDHTVLKQTTTWQDVVRLCDQAIAGGVASVCIPPSYVARAKEYVADKMAVCTVIGFPNGYQTTLVKLVETKEALSAGADEIDVVVNLGDIKNGDWDLVQQELAALKKACGKKVLKVIVECCYLTEEEKIKMCEIITALGIDYIKTSTGFGSGGATIEDIELFKQHIGPEVKIKAAGGIRDLAAAEQYLNLGVSRIGSSNILNQ